MTPDRELKALVDMNSEGLWIACDTLGYELRARNSMNNVGLRLT